MNDTLENAEQALLDVKLALAKELQRPERERSENRIIDLRFAMNRLSGDVAKAKAAK